jgi:uncharacterized membrane protein
LGKGRIEAFSDGVLAIIITIMVLELKVPRGVTLLDTNEILPSLLSYVLSFVLVAIYWTNHHHLFQAVREVSGGALWANLHLLLWLSLFPVSTAWMGQSGFAAQPVRWYGVVLLGAAIAYAILVQVLLRRHGPGSDLAVAIGRDFKGLLSVGLYVLAIAVSWWNRWLSFSLYVVVALIWLVPDRRVERALARRNS